MNNLKRCEQLKEEEYQGIFGVTKATFDKMLLILEEAYEQQHSKGGSPLKCLSILDKLIIALEYYREYRTMRHIAFDYGVSKSMVHKSIHWVEDVLIRSKEFSLPSKRSLVETKDVKAVLVDVTECEIERPQKTERLLFRQEEEAYDESPDHCRRFDSGCSLYFRGQRQPT